MTNQGDVVGNKKGYVFIVTQNGEMLPWGTPKFAVGIVAPSVTTLLSGKAFAASLGAAQTKRKKKKKRELYFNLLNALIWTFPIYHHIIPIILRYLTYKKK